MPVDHAQLSQICAAAKTLAFSTFDSICVAPNSRLRNLLKQHIHDRAHALQQQNMEVSRVLTHRDTLARWNQLKEECGTSVAALESIVAIASTVSLSDQGPGVWEGLGRCTIDVILPEVIAMARQFDFETSRAHAIERDSLHADISYAQTQTQAAVHKVQELQDCNNELVQHRDRLIDEKVNLEELCSAVKAQLEAKSREMQSLQLSSDSAKEILLQQLDASLQKNTSYAAQVHMLESDVRAAKERESDLQSCLQTLHDDHREKEEQLSAQMNAASAALEALSSDHQQARVREEDLRVECAVLKERLQHASDAAAADLASIQQQLETAASKARDAVKSRDAFEATIFQREQEHSEALRALMIESAQREAALESKLFQQTQLDASNRQQLQDMAQQSLEFERKLKELETLHQLLVQEHLTLSQVHEKTKAELESVKLANEEFRIQHDQKMQLLLHESSQNQQRLHDLQQSLQKEQSLGQDAILAGTEVLQELARLKLEMCTLLCPRHSSTTDTLTLYFAEKMRPMKRGLHPRNHQVVRRRNPKVPCLFLQGRFDFVFDVVL